MLQISLSKHAVDGHLAEFHGILHNDSTPMKQVQFTLRFIVNQKVVWSNDLDPPPDGLVVLQEIDLSEKVANYLDSVDEK